MEKFGYLINNAQLENPEQQIREMDRLQKQTEEARESYNHSNSTNGLSLLPAWRQIRDAVTEELNALERSLKSRNPEVSARAGQRISILRSMQKKYLPDVCLQKLRFESKEDVKDLINRFNTIIRSLGIGGGEDAKAEIDQAVEIANVHLATKKMRIRNEGGRVVLEELRRERNEFNGKTSEKWRENRDTFLSLRENPLDSPDI